MFTAQNEYHPMAFAQSCLFKIKSNHPGLSTLQLAKRLGMSQPTLSRIENLSLKNTSFANIFNLIRAAYPEEKNYEELIKTYCPQYLTNYKQLSEASMHCASRTDLDVENYLTNPQTFEFVMRASSDHGLDQEFLKNQFGDHGIAMMQKLCSADVVALQGDKYVNNSIVNFSKETAQKLSTLLISNSLDCHRDDEARGGIAVSYNSVNKSKVLPKLRSLAQTFRREIDSILQDPSNSGKDVVWTSLALDTLPSWAI